MHEVKVVNSFSGNGADGTHFSYEDQGELKLHVLLTLSMMILSTLTLKEYLKYYKEEERMCSPHPILLISLCI